MESLQPATPRPARPPTLDVAALPPRARAARWTQAVSTSYFPLDLAFREPDRFTGRLTGWALGEVGVSRLRSTPVRYRRDERHVSGSRAGEEAFLVTVPRTGTVRFDQMGRDVTCPPGGFLIEHSQAPYTFSYAEPSDLIAVKLPAPLLARHLPDPGRYCALGFDARGGVGALMVDMLRSTQARWSDMTAPAREALGRQAVELLALAVEGDPRALESRGDTLRAAHLARMERVLAARHTEPDLTPGRIARACGLSTRHLHALCRADGMSVGERLRETRLLAVRTRLSRAGDTRSITEIALACGFSDGSALSRAYRARFGETPRETRARGRAEAFAGR